MPAEVTPATRETSTGSEAQGADASQAGTGATADSPAPAWAKRLRRRQAMFQGATLAAHTLRSADHHGGSAHISLEDRS